MAAMLGNWARRPQVSGVMFTCNPVSGDPSMVAVNASWGLHLIDANIAMGNLVDVVGAEAKAYLARK